MIFNKFFTPKYKHKQPSKRLEAISEVVSIGPANKSWLHDLAFNDEDNEVKVAALNVLDDATLWLKAYEESSDKLKTKAMQELLERLEDTKAVPTKLFEEIVLNKKYSEITKRLRQTSERLRGENDLFTKILLEHGSESEIARHFSSCDSITTQQALIEYFSEDEKVLKRLKKKQVSAGAVKLIDEKLAKIQFKLEKPKQIIQEGKLINAQLNALLDSNDYEYVLRNKDSLCNSFEKIKSEFVYLSDANISELTEKYLLIKQRLDARLSSLLPEYNNKKAKSKITEEQDELSGQISTIAEQVELLLDLEDVDGFSIQHELLSNAVEDAYGQVQTMLSGEQNGITNIHRTRFSELNTKIEHIRKTLGNAQDIIINNASLLHHLDDIQTIWNDFEKEVISILELQQKYDELRQNLFPKSQYSQNVWKKFNTAAKVIEKALAEYISSQKQVSQRCMAKLKVVSSLISAGKYKGALNAFKSAEKMYNSVNLPSRPLSKKFSDVSDAVENIVGWQSYIALPKKPELLTQAQELLNSDELQINDLSAKIKQLRSDWNSLGKLDTDEDDEINKRFDETLEKAFEPCREHYAKLEKQRAENAEVVSAILTELKELDEGDDKQLFINTYNELTRKYHGVKALDHQQRRDFQKEYKVVIQPLKSKIAGIYEDRVRQKKRLIKQASELNVLEDTEAASIQAKQLQQTWKTIGFAGKSEDQALWKQFRECNDNVFSKLSEIRDQKKAYSRDLFEEYTDTIKNIVKEPELSAATSAQLLAIKSELGAIKVDEASIGQGNTKKINSELKNAQHVVEGLLKQKLKSEKSSELNQLFDTILNKTQSNNLSFISGIIKQGLDNKLDQHPVYDDFSKQQLFQSILLMLDENTHVDDSALRLQLLAAKLEGRADLSAKLSFAHWLARGDLTKDDVSLLEKNKAILIENANRIL